MDSGNRFSPNSYTPMGMEWKVVEVGENGLGADIFMITCGL